MAMQPRQPMSELRYTVHARRRRRQRAPLSRVEDAIPVPSRVMKAILDLSSGPQKPGARAQTRRGSRKVRKDLGRGRKGWEKDRAKYRATASGVYVIQRSVVVTVLPLHPGGLADILWWLMTR